ncbi:hypothetical protein FACS1894110_19840 [Spirochaetia bacterium]|nr:hypothetical protein FACS1894110_19840 [Spirochaetia bacterium]
MPDTNKAFPYYQLSPPATGVCDGHAGDNGGGGCQGIAWPSQKDMQFPDRTPDYAFACPWDCTVAGGLGAGDGSGNAPPSHNRICARGTARLQGGSKG